MNKLIQQLEKQNNITETHNGAVSYKSSLNACVDFFANGGSMRSRSDQDIISLFTKAYAENPLIALRTAFFIRDVRGGLGERKVFRTILKYLATINTPVVEKNFEFVPVFGRWDDLLVLAGNPKLWNEFVELVQDQLDEDLVSDNPSLLAKWLPSCNTHSQESRRLAKKLYTSLGWSAKHYRKTLSTLRKKINIVETKLCQNEWGDVNYEHVPSRAAMIYRKAFARHDGKRYQDYLQDVEDGKAEIKASTLYPYDIVRNIITPSHSWGSNKDFSFNKPDKTLLLQWNALPDYIQPFNGLVVYDTSGSMGSSCYYGGKATNVRPIDVALSLAIYIAERNTGVWQNCAIPFSDGAHLCKFQGNNIYEKLMNLDMTSYYGSTNLQAVFDLILSTALRNNLSQDDMPEKLFIVSDMQWDQACVGNRLTNFETIERKYASAGYTRPQLIFWNVNAYSKDSPVKFDEMGTALVSGASPAILKSVLSGEVLTPYDVMMNAISVDRYKVIKV